MLQTGLESWQINTKYASNTAKKSQVSREQMWHCLWLAEIMALMKTKDIIQGGPIKTGPP